MSPDFRDHETPSLELHAEQIVAAKPHMSREEWEAYRDRESAGNPRLRELVKSLLPEIGGEETGPYPASPPEQQSAGSVSLPEPGQLPTIPGYEILEEVGRGGMGVVYKARHVKLNRLVALKMILGGERAGRGDLTRFLAEAKAVAAIKHENVVQVFDYGEAAGRPFMALDYLSGGTLSRVLRESAGRPLAPRDAARLVSQIARGVAATHILGIVHRDLKPGNVLFDEAGTPKVADFGLALRMEGARGVTQSGQIDGTPQYMAPEQARGEPVLTTAVDVYGLGAILYALLTGLPPFKGGTDKETLAQVGDPELAPVPPRVRAPRVDPDLDAVCRKCLEKSPDRRYQSAESLAGDLELWLARKETSVLKWDRPYRLWRLVKRHGALSATVGVAVALAGVWDLRNAWARLTERESQVLLSNAYTARSVARTVEERLQRWSSAVMREVRDGSLRTHLRQRDQAELQKLVERAHAFHASPASGFTREGAAPPFASWFVMDGRGQILAHAGGNVRAEGEFPWRDYFRGASGKKDGAAYVSRVYHSHLAGEYYKFAIAVPIWDGADLSGVLVATVLTDSAEETLLPGDAPQKAALIGRWDGNSPDKPTAGVRTDKHTPGQRLILLHSAYERGHVAAEVHNEKLFDADEFRRNRYCLDDRYEDPVTRAKTNDAVRWLAASAPVGGTEFVVVVQQDYDGAVRPYAITLRPLLLWIAVAVLVLGWLAALFWSVRQRRRGVPS